jgi:hypothetical protein
MELAALAPDEPEVEEPVMELAALAPDEPEVDEPVIEVAALAPDEPEVEEPVMELAALPPDDDLLSDEVTDEPLLTRTMGELYAQQGLTERALDVFRQLLQADPGDEDLRDRVRRLEEAGREVPVHEAAGHEEAAPGDDDDLQDYAWTAAQADDGAEVDTPFAWTEEEAADVVTGPSIAAYFERLLSWGSGASEEGPDVGEDV